MKDIIISIIVLTFVTAIARMILPRIEVFVQWLIKKFVSYSEKKIQGSKMGAVRKAKVLKWLRIFGIKSSKFVDVLIDSAVDVMNSKGCDISSTIQSDVADKVVDKIEDSTKKLIK